MSAKTPIPLGPELDGPAQSGTDPGIEHPEGGARREDLSSSDASGQRESGPVPTETSPPELPRPTQSVEVKIKLLPRRANDNLGSFFSASDAHVRVYEFFLALIRHHAVRTASAMAFDLFLALIPMLALSAWTISRLLHDRPDALLQGSLIMDLTPSELRGFLSQNLRAFSGKQLAPAALLVCWWLSSSAFYTMISLFEEAFPCQPRSWLKGRLLSLAFALVGLSLFVFATAAGFLLTLEQLAAVRALLKTTGEAGLLPFTLGLAVWFILAGYLALIYRFSIRRPRFRRRVWPGAFIAATLGLAASVSLAFYATNIGRYSLFYGSLAAIVVVMLWLWLWCSAILLGAELNITLEDVRVIRTEDEAVRRTLLPVSSRPPPADATEARPTSSPTEPSRTEPS